MFFRFKQIPFEGVVHMLYQKKCKSRYFKDTSTHVGSTLAMLKIQKT